MQTVYDYIINTLTMATFKITPETTVAELKEQFRNEVGGTLRIYSGRSEADDGAALVSLGAKEGVLECRTSRTVGSFEKAFQDELGLKVKVYTKDNWVKVLDGITLESASKLPNGMTKAKMEEYVSNYSKSGKAVNEEETTNDNKMNAKVNFHCNCKGVIPYDYEDEKVVFVFDRSFPYEEDDTLPLSNIEMVEYGTAEKVEKSCNHRDDWGEIFSEIQEKNIVVYYASDADVEGISLNQLNDIMCYMCSCYWEFEDPTEDATIPSMIDIFINDVKIGTLGKDSYSFSMNYVEDICPITKFLQNHNALRYNLNDK